MPPLNELNKMNEINQVVHTPLPGQLIANYHDDEERTQRKRFQYRRKKKWFAQLIFFPFRKENPYTCLWKKKWTKKFFFLSRSHLIITEEQLPLPCPWNKRKCGEKNSVDRGVLSGPEKAPKKIKIKMEDGHFFSSLSLFFNSTFFPPLRSWRNYRWPGKKGWKEGTNCLFISLLFPTNLKWR